MNKALTLLAATIILVSMFAPTALGQSCESDSGKLIKPGQGVNLSQITFSFDGDSSTEPSASGEVDVNVPQLTTLMSSGFINIVVEDVGWVTQNLPVLPGYPYNDVSTRFNLGVAAGKTVSNLNAAICYSPDPFSAMPDDAPNQVFAVGSAAYNGQGKCTDGKQGAACRITADPPPPAIGMTFAGGLVSFTYQPNHPNLQAADNQCAPAAFANNFTWLKTTYGTPVADPNTVGLRNIQNNNSLVGKLDMTFWSGPDYPPEGTNDDPSGSVVGRYADVSQGLFGRLSGEGVNSYWIVIGSMTYLIKNNINLKYYHQGTSGRFDGTQNIVLGPLSSIGKGKYVDPEFIFSEVDDGSAVEGGFEYDEGGHEVSIVGAGTILGAPFILYVSDHEQTPIDLTDSQGTDEVDFSFLCQPDRGEGQDCAPDPTQASPYAEEEGGTLTDIIIEHP